MTKRIIFQNDDGGVSVIVPAPGATLEQLAAAVPAGVYYQFIDVSEIPTDRTFRGAWVIDGGTVGIDLIKAKGIAHEKRRAARAAEFAPLDVQATIPAKADIAEAARQQVREKYDAMQTAIDAAATADEIKAAMP